MKHANKAKPTFAHKVVESVKHATRPAPKQIDPLKSEPKPTFASKVAEAFKSHPAPSKPKDPMDNPRALEKARAYLRLCQLNDAPAVTFTPVEQALYERERDAATARDEKSRREEIIKNRKILNLSVEGLG